MEPVFEIEQLKQKNDPKLEETVIVKICKKKEAVDDVFSDKLVEPGPLIVDKTYEKFDRDYVLNRLRKMMNGDSIEEFKLPIKRAEIKEVKEVKEEFSYKEKQVAHLCAKHAFNHLVQEEKIVWIKDKSTLVNKKDPDASSKNKDTKINLWGFCKERGITQFHNDKYQTKIQEATDMFNRIQKKPEITDDYYNIYEGEKQKKEYTQDLELYNNNHEKYGKYTLKELQELFIADLVSDPSSDKILEIMDTSKDGCTMSGRSAGNLPMEWFEDIFKLLDYEYIVFNKYKTDVKDPDVKDPDVKNKSDEEIKEILNTNLNKSNCLGLIINQGAWHYISIPKFHMEADCLYAVADSIKTHIYDCYNTIDELYEKLKKINYERGYFVFANDKSYKSVAVDRMKKKHPDAIVETIPKEKAKVDRKTRITKKQLPIPESMVVFTNTLFNEMTKQKKHAIHKAPSYYMTNRGLFIRELNKLFEPHAIELSKVNDADVSCDKRSTEDFEILTHQRVVRDYLNLYSPYRGLIIYHGLGSGKTCTSIAVAEGMKSEKQIIVMTPASLKSNFFSELKKCGDDIYRKNQKWIKVSVTERKDASQIKKVIGLDEEYILENGVWLGKKSGDGKKFEDLSPAEQIEVDKQLDLIIRKKYNDINYNGLNGRKLNELTDNGKINPFDNKVVIVDEAHNFVSRIVNKIKKPESLSYRLYDYLMSAQNVKIVFLTGTPIINYPNEIAILFNMLRGYIKTWTFIVQQTTTDKVDRDKILEFFKKDGFNTYDYVEYSGNKVMVTRNPFGFVNKSKNSSKNSFKDYDGVKLDESGNMSDTDFKNTIIKILNKNGLSVKKNEYDPIKTLPDDADTFISKFIDPETGNLINEDLFKRRILGLTSYFKSAQENLLPDILPIQIVNVDMSDHQIMQYSEARKRERNEEKQNAKKFNEDLFEKTSTYRIYSRELCNFVFPDEYVRPSKKRKEADVNKDADDFVEEEEVDDTNYTEELEKALTFLKENGDRYLSKEGLEMLSPKFLHLLENLEDVGNQGLHLVYSQFRTIEGIGVLKLILEQNGFAEFKLVKRSGKWDIDIKEEYQDKPKFVLYTGTEDAEQKEIIRNIYNSNWSQVSSTIRTKLEKINANNFMGEIIKVFMITSSGAEGINLENTRFVHIVEPYWHPVRSEQVIGRARRICSHKNLPKELRNVQVFLYLSKMTKEQLEKNIEIRTKDEGKTTDQYLYEVSNTKERINKQILKAVKETAMDCSLYKKGSEDLVCYNLGNVQSNDFLTVPILEQDTMQNVVKPKGNLKGVKMQIYGKSYIAVKISSNEPEEIEEGEILENIKIVYQLYDIDPPNNYYANAIYENNEWRIE
jgi:hypothetical protein